MVEEKEHSQEQNHNLIPTEQSTREKKTTITLAIKQNVLDELKEEADKDQTSLSAKVSMILSKHIVTYRFSQDIKSVFVSEKTFSLIVNQINEELLLDDFTNNAIDFIPTVFLAKNIPFTLDNIIKYALRGAGLDGGIYNHLHHYKDQKGFTNIVMRHNFGLKWSRILSKGQSHLIEKMLGCQTSSIILPSSVTLKVPPLIE
jgi:hypothetical protein